MGNMVLFTFELSQLFNISNTLFTIGGQGVSLLELIAVLSGLTCVFMAVRGKVLNFWM